MRTRSYKTNKTNIVARQACRATRGVHYLEIACCWISLAHILCNKSGCSQFHILQRIIKTNTRQACRATRGSHSCDFAGIRSLPLGGLCLCVLYNRFLRPHMHSRGGGRGGASDPTRFLAGARCILPVVLHLGFRPQIRLCKNSGRSQL